MTDAQGMVQPQVPAVTLAAAGARPAMHSLCCCDHPQFVIGSTQQTHEALPPGLFVMNVAFFCAPAEPSVQYETVVKERRMSEKLRRALSGSCCCTLVRAAVRTSSSGSFQAALPAGCSLASRKG